MKILPPALYVTGDADPGYALAGAQLAAMPAYVPNLLRMLVIPGAGHWIGEERPEEVNRALVEFLRGL
jgi:pimeloyl-ACP methyl ester carboxylesterase